jgi:ABC-2 type transport system permease protein
MEMIENDTRKGSISDLILTFLIMKYQIKFYLKTRRFIAMLAIVLLISAVVVIVDFYVGVSQILLQDSSSSIYISSGVGFVGLSVGLVASFFGGDATSIETGTNSGYFIMVQPVRKISILVGRYLAAVTLGVGLILIEYLTVAGMSQYIFGTIDWRILLSVGEMVLLVLAYTSLAFFFSSIFKSPIIGILISVIFSLILFSVIDAIMEGTNIEPWFSLNYAEAVIGNIVYVSNFQHVSTTHFGKFFTKIFTPYIWEGTLIMGAYAVVGFVLSYLLFMRKEVKPQ